MKGFRVEGQQLGAAQTETVAHPGECRNFGHATKLHSFKSHNTHEDREFRVPIPVTVGTFETTVRPSPGYRVYTMGGGYLPGGLLTRNTFDKQPPNDHLLLSYAAATKKYLHQVEIDRPRKLHSIDLEMYAST